VAFEFGPFQLDEPGRILRLAEREVPLQPRVFDLLAYLVRNRERVVSKEELLDHLWPSVTVTENSLQRAVSSLRSALRDGGMEDVIRNYPRAGYRFCINSEGKSHAGGMVINSGAVRDQVQAARRAAAEQRWEDTVHLYASADIEEPLEANDLDGWAAALQCLGRPSAAIPILVRSVAAAYAGRRQRSGGGQRRRIGDDSPRTWRGCRVQGLVRSRTGSCRGRSRLTCGGTSSLAGVAHRRFRRLPSGGPPIDRGRLRTRQAPGRR